jgi:hypothetical protein
MNLHSPKNHKEITREIIEIANNIRDLYVNRYGEILKWSLVEQDMFLMNSDAQILCLLEKHNLKAHSIAYAKGITLGVLNIQRSIAFEFTKNYGENLSDIHKDYMFQMLLKNIYGYVIKGETHAY